MSQRMRWSSVFLSVILMLVGCSMSGRQEDEKWENLSDAKLVVYLNGMPSYMFKGEEEILLYPSPYTAGLREISGEIDCPNGNIVEKALKDYSKETGVQIEVHYMRDRNTASLQSLYEEGKEMPDLVIGTRDLGFDYFRLAKQEMLYDFSPFLEEDEQIAYDELYYQSVLDGGVIANRQIVMPILFNLNGLITTEEYLDRIGYAMPGEQATFEDIMLLLTESCIAMTGERYTEPIVETSGMGLGGTYIPSILWGAAYSNYFDESVTDLYVKEETAVSIMQLMDYYQRQEYENIIGWETIPYSALISHTGAKTVMTNSSLAFENQGESIGVYLSGGRSGGCYHNNCILTDAVYFNSVYKENGKEMVFCGIPTTKRAESYSSNLSLFAYSFANNSNPDEVYQLCRYLMDYKFPPFYGFSVNREITKEYLKQAQETSLEIYPDAAWNSYTMGVISGEGLEECKIILSPLDSKYVQIIENMLSHLEGAGLPFAPLENGMVKDGLEELASLQSSSEQVGVKMVDQLEEYLKIVDNLKPFYDEGYIYDSD